jgi:hypothetical protein
MQFVVENMVGVHGMMNYVDSRTQFFDEMVNKALDDGIRQVVVLAAGYDTRPYRLHRPYTQVRKEATTLSWSRRKAILSGRRERAWCETERGLWGTQRTGTLCQGCGFVLGQ